MSRMVALVVVSLMACKDDRAAKAQAQFDRAVEKSGGIERDKDGRPYKEASGKYLDGTGGSVAPAKRVPSALPPEPPETDVTRGQYAEFTDKKDEARALYEKACSEKVAGGCAYLARLDKNKDPNGTAAKLKTMCDAKDGAACYSLGTMYELVALDEEHTADDVIALYDAGCVLQWPDACNELGMVYHSGRGGAPKDKTKAVDALTRGCELGDRQSCLQIQMVMSRP